jgi:hypothetical protein
MKMKGGENWIVVRSQKQEKHITKRQVLQTRENQNDLETPHDRA